ncbi:MAG: type I secretion C-terminal target domain-containing protein [Rivularia sp. ALOHA_DT_140]|nr:type I secretion C-terminal target domain-containing protein [Rivularia sp. ALOHA_DT_140]
MASIGNVGNDTLDGGNGNDTISYRRETDKVNVNLEAGIATEFSGDTDTLTSIENVIGSAGDDEIIGDDNSNIIFGEEGKDSLQGKQGDDKLIGGKDGDVIDGGEGNDTTSYFTAKEAVTANLTNTQENTGDAQGDSFQSIENLEGSEFGDRLIGDVQNNDIRGLGGDDSLDGLTGDDTMSGGSGNDTYKVESVNDVVIENINQGIDTVDAAIDYILGANLENLNLLEGTSALSGTGNELNNIINGNSRNNTLNGEAGNDTLVGLSGNDVISGGDGDDSITGGLGNESFVPGSLGKINGVLGSDILTGGSGNDAFIYNNIADTGDLITDFTVGEDKIVVAELLQSLGYAGSDPINDGLLGFKQASESLAVLQIDPDGSASELFRPVPFILLDNVSIAALNDSSNFVF